jgi:hypothetical protein
MYLTVGGADANVSAAIVVSGATSDGTDYSGAELYVEQTDGSATVNGNITVANSDSVYVEMGADEEGDSDGSLTDVVSVSLTNVTNSNYSAVYLDDFETITVSVTGESEIDELDASGNEASVAFKSQTMTINATADFTIDSYSEMAQTGSTALTVTGSGNVELADFYGTNDTLSSTVKSSIDASALTGDLSVDIQHAIQSFKGGSGDDTAIFENTTTFGSSTLGGLAASGGAGEDTIGMNVASWNTISAGTATQRAAISGWENLLISDVLPDTTVVDLAKLSGLTGFTAANGIAAGGTATVKNVGSTTTVGLEGDLAANNGTLALVLKLDGTDDTANLTLHPLYA